MGVSESAVESVGVTNATSFLKAYAGVKTLVTGHTGFKGSWLASWLQLLGAEVSGFALAPENGNESLFARANVADAMSSAIGDIRDPIRLEEEFTARSPEIIFHLAAQSLVRRSYLKPVETFATNVMGTVHVLEAARSTSSVQAIVVVTSDKAYANPDSGAPVREGDPMGGKDPYSASKGATELVVTAFRHAFMSSDGGALLASARAGNVIGPGDASEDRLVPDVIRAIRDNSPVVIRNPESTRPWQYVLEPLRGYLMLGARLLEGDRAFAEGWNFGPDPSDARRVEELARRIIDAWGSGELRIASEGTGPHEASLLSLDISKARDALDFHPVMDIEATIEWTVAGYQALKPSDGQARQVLVDQIASYEALL